MTRILLLLPDCKPFFGADMVVVEDRITGQTVDSKPQVFVDSLIKEHRETVKFFSSPSTQRNFLEKAAQQKTKFSMFTNRLTTEKISVTDQIQKSLIKGTKLVHFGKEKFVLPSIREQHLTALSQGLHVYMDSILQVIVANRGLANQEVNAKATKAKVIELTASPTRYLTTNPGRREVYNLLLASLVLEDIVLREQSEFTTTIQTYSLIYDDQGGGAFIRLCSSADTVATRLESVVNTASMRSAISTSYNLKLNQIRNLISYIFDRDSLIRVEAKINLVSSLSPDIRNYVVLSPSEVLLRGFAEHYLTRSEVLHLMFNSSASTRSDAAKRCIYCYTVCSLLPNSVRHGPCPITD